ncbi:hypothetical protein N7539_004715 [Penicillium diatomitis]|uniref:Uncharacterized protein n=1 Tax=Penicillium diatomitis TaxID=2819901 RepID=A0A9X0BU83_9EURO|nr:uncharacterized protein N7539_004715 [Penicillium diatomitis]KAJ5484727.1 hypothetical protein N7539_004715 [Penicillium diatomitis]
MPDSDSQTFLSPATTRRLSDTSTSEHSQFKKSAKGSGKQGKSMLDSAHETVAKALGGGSRGE